MMKKQLALTIFATLSFLAACKKESVKTPEPTPIKLLSKIIEVRALPVRTTTFTIYTYDDKKRISTITRGGTEKTTYIYKGDELFSTTTELGKVKYNSETSYSGGKPVSVISKVYDSGVLKNESKFGYIYTGDRVTEIHVNDNGVVAQKRFYEYDNNNIIENDSQTDVFLSVKNIYGDKKNMYYNSRLKYIYPIELFDRFSANEILKSIITYPDGSSLTKVYEYKYDNEGFPITLSMDAIHSSNSSIDNYKYTFEYKTY